MMPRIRFADGTWYPVAPEPEGDVMSVAIDGREAQGRCLLCGRPGFVGVCDACGDTSEYVMPGDPGSHDLLSDYGYSFDRFDDDEGAP